MGQARRRTAKAEREFGPVRFAADVVDAGVARPASSSSSGRSTPPPAREDYFAEPDTRGAAGQAAAHPRAPLRRHAVHPARRRPHLLAAHFGIRSGAVLHWWFPVYDPEFAALAPGWILLRELVAGRARAGHRPDRPRSWRRRVQAAGEDRRDHGLPGDGDRQRGRPALPGGLAARCSRRRRRHRSARRSASSCAHHDLSEAIVRHNDRCGRSGRNWSSTAHGGVIA